MEMIVAKDLVKLYNEVAAVDIPEIKINRGESFGLVGNNGAGKTTFFRLILDLIRANKGFILSKEKNVKQSEHWKEYTGSYLDEDFLISFLTPEEYFDFIGKVSGLSKDDISAFYERFKDFFSDEILGKKKYIRDFSRGNQQKIGIASALMTIPEVLILDEPFVHLDPSTQIRLKNMLNELKTEKGITMLISSHDLNHVTEVCERIVVLEKGQVIHDIVGTKNTLKELEAYFSV